MSTQGGKRPMFGRIDPFCLLAVVPTLLVAALMAAQGLWLIGLGCVAFAGLIVLFDSWVNRPEAPDPASRPARPRADEQTYRAPQRQPRPPQRQPQRRPDQRNMR